MCSRKLTRRLRSSDRSSRPPSPQYRQTQRSGRKEDRTSLLFSSIVPRDLQVRNTNKRNALGKEGRQESTAFLVDRSSRPPSPQYRQTQRVREGRKIGKHCFSRRSFLATSKSAIPTKTTRSGRRKIGKHCFSLQLCDGGQNGDDPQEDLAKSGYKINLKVNS